LTLSTRRVHHNPDGLKNQIDGKVIQTVSRTLLEKLTWDHSMVTSLDWASYPIIIFPDVPEVVTDLIDPAEQGAVHLDPTEIEAREIAPGQICR
jgi:CO/xanthine dehydrogenase Mo-binding subunit